MQKIFFSPIFALVLAVFIDSFALSLVAPLYPLLVLDNGPSAFLALDTTMTVRGTLLGCLGMGFMIGQFFAAPLLGDLSNNKGIKKVLIPVLLGVALSNFLGGWSILESSVVFLLFSQFIRGATTGNRTILQLFAVSIDGGKNKIRNLGYFGGGTGLGLILGPLCASFLISGHNDPVVYTYPFWLAGILALLNAFLCSKLLKTPSSNDGEARPWSFSKGFCNLKRALNSRQLKPLFLVILCYFIGWEMFYSFGPIFLMQRLKFSSWQIGMFYTLVGAWMIFGNTLLVRFTSKYPSEKVLRYVLPLWGIALLGIAYFHNSSALWAFLPLLPSLGGVIMSTTAAWFTDVVDLSLRGEVLGIFQSLQSAAAGATFICTGTLAAHFPTLPLVAGALFLFIATWLWFFKVQPLKVQSAK